MNSLGCTDSWSLILSAPAVARIPVMVKVKTRSTALGRGLELVPLSALL